MASGCRDCRVCLRAPMTRFGTQLLLLTFTCGLWLLVKPFTKQCPQCRHRMGRHERRADGSFKD